MHDGSGEQASETVLLSITLIKCCAESAVASLGGAEGQSGRGEGSADNGSDGAKRGQRNTEWWFWAGVLLVGKCILGKSWK